MNFLGWMVVIVGTLLLFIMLGIVASGVALGLPLPTCCRCASPSPDCIEVLQPAEMTYLPVLTFTKKKLHRCLVEIFKLLL